MKEIAIAIGLTAAIAAGIGFDKVFPSGSRNLVRENGELREDLKECQQMAAEATRTAETMLTKHELLLNICELDGVMHDDTLRRLSECEENHEKLDYKVRKFQPAPTEGEL